MFGKESELPAMPSLPLETEKVATCPLPGRLAAGTRGMTESTPFQQCQLLAVVSKPQSPLMLVVSAAATRIRISGTLLKSFVPDQVLLVSNAGKVCVCARQLALTTRINIKFFIAHFLVVES